MSNSIKQKKFLFNWEGIDEQGYRVKGSNYALNQHELYQILRLQGIAPIHFKKKFFLFPSLQEKSLKPKHIEDFTYQLTLLLQAGIELVPALNMLAVQTNLTELKQLL